MMDHTFIQPILIRRSTRKIYTIFTILMMVFSTAYAQNNPEPDKQPDYPIIKPAGFAQQHFSVDDTDGNPVSFSTHRARLGFAGQFSEKIKLNFIIGAVEPPERKPALVNAFADFDIHPLFQLRTGQFLVPFGLEGPEPIFLNPAIERSHPVRQMNTYRMFRDIGAMASGKYAFLSYSLAVLNGNGANTTEFNDQKDIVFRVNLNPLPGLDVGLSGQTGHFDGDSLNNLNRNRWAAHAEFDKDAVFLRSEFMLRDMETGPDKENIRSQGGYLLGGYRLSEKWNVIGRMEYYQPDEQDNADYQGLTLGSNYFLTGQTRLSLNGMAFTQTGDYDDMQYGLNIQLQFVL